MRSEILINCHDEHPSTDVVFALAYRLLDPTQQHLVNYDWFKFIHNKNAIHGLSRIRNYNDYLLTHTNHEKIYVGEKRVSRVFHYHVTIDGKEFEVSLEKKLEVLQHGEDSYTIEDGNIVKKKPRAIKSK